MKITKNANINPLSEETTRLGKVDIDFWKLSPNMYLKRNFYT